MKKYIVKQVYNDDNTLYWEGLKEDLECNFNDSIFIGLNKEFTGVNNGLLDVIKEDVIFASDYMIENYYNNNHAVYIIDTIKPFKRISLKQALNIIKEIKNHKDIIYNKLDLIKNILSIIYCSNFDYINLRGYCQGDWIYCFYNKDSISFDFIQYIEAVIWNTGIEIAITCEAIEIITPLDNKNIQELEDNYDIYYDYMVDYFFENEKVKHIASIIGCKEDDILFYPIKNIKTNTVVNYDIEY